MSRRTVRYGVAIGIGMNVPICLHLVGLADRGGGVGNLSEGGSGRCWSSSQVASGGFEMHLGSSPKAWESVGRLRS